MAAFLKIGDIKGELSQSWEARVNRFTTGGGGDSLNSWRDVRDHNHGKFTDAITNGGQQVGLDVGPVNQTADILIDRGASNFTAEVGWWTVDGADFRASNATDAPKNGGQGPNISGRHTDPVYLDTGDRFNCDDILLGHSVATRSSLMIHWFSSCK